jgi:hypothetical protein
MLGGGLGIARRFPGLPLRNRRAFLNFIHQPCPACTFSRKNIRPQQFAQFPKQVGALGNGGNHLTFGFSVDKLVAQVKGFHGLEKKHVSGLTLVKRYKNTPESKK